MSFAQEIKDFTEGFKTTSSIMDKRRDRADRKERDDLNRKERESTRAGFDSPEQQERFKRIGAGRDSAIPDDGHPRGVSEGGAEGDYSTEGMDDQDAGRMLGFIRQKESGGNYNKLVYKNGGADGGEADLTGMTLQQVQDYQTQMIKNGHASSAVGAYQIIQPTLQAAIKTAGLDPSKTLFTPQVQDQLGLALMKNRGYDDYRSGKLDADRFMKNLSQEWASLPKDKSGKSFYEGDAVGNHAGADWGTFSSILAGPQRGGASAPVTRQVTPAIPETPVASTTPHDQQGSFVQAVPTPEGEFPSPEEEERWRERDAAGYGFAEGGAVPAAAPFVPRRVGQRADGSMWTPTPRAIPEPGQGAAARFRAMVDARNTPAVAAPPGQPAPLPQGRTAFDMDKWIQANRGQNYMSGMKSKMGTVDSTGWSQANGLTYDANGNILPQYSRGMGGPAQAGLGNRNSPYADYDAPFRNRFLVNPPNRTSNNNQGGAGPGGANRSSSGMYSEGGPVRRGYAIGGIVDPNDYDTLDPGSGPVREDTGALWRLEASKPKKPPIAETHADPEGARKRLTARQAAYEKAPARTKTEPTNVPSPKPSTATEGAIPEPSVGPAPGTGGPGKPGELGTAVPSSPVPVEPPGTITTRSGGRGAPPPIQTAVPEPVDPTAEPLPDERAESAPTGLPRPTLLTGLPEEGPAAPPMPTDLPPQRLAEGERPPPRPAIPEDAPAPQVAAATPEPPKAATPPPGAPKGGETPRKGAKGILSTGDATPAIAAGMKFIEDDMKSTPRGAAVGPDRNKDVKLNRFMANEGAYSTAEYNEIAKAVDPEGKLTGAERNQKILQDQFDFYIAEGLPQKAQQAAASLLMYGRRVSQLSGNMALAALEGGNLEAAGKFMQKAYDHLPDGKELRIGKQVSEGGKPGLEYEVVDLETGETEDGGVATQDEMTTMAKQMANGGMWGQEVLRAAQGLPRSRRGGSGAGRAGAGTRGPSASETSRADKSAALSALGDIGQRYRAEQDPAKKQALLDEYTTAEQDAASAGVPEASLKGASRRWGTAAPKAATGKAGAIAQDKAEDDTAMAELDTKIGSATDPAEKARFTRDKAMIPISRAFKNGQLATKRVVNTQNLNAALEVLENVEDGAKPILKELARGMTSANEMDEDRAVEIGQWMLTEPKIKVRSDGTIAGPDGSPIAVSPDMLQRVAAYRKSKQGAAAPAQ